MKLTPFGKAVRGQRLEKELALAEMAHRVGVSPAFASAVETGTKNIPAGYVDKVCRALACDHDEETYLKESAELSAKDVRIIFAGNSSRTDREVAAIFARRFPLLSTETKNQLRVILEAGNDE